MQSTAEGTGKFAGVTVLDLSQFLPGPLLTMMMADHGARVIRLESLGEGEPNRNIGQRRDGTTVYFANTHRGKESLALNLKNPAAKAAFDTLAKQVDVIVESFRPGVAARLGVDYESVRKIAPGVVYVSISAYGQDGPMAQAPAHDVAVQALSGLLSNNVDANDVPVMPGLPAGDMLASTLGLAGVAMALLRRTQTGVGDYLDLAMLDSILSCMPNSMGAAFADKVAPVPKDERIWGGHAMYRIYATKDGQHLALGGSEIKFARNLLTALDRLDLLPLCSGEPGPVQLPVVEYFTTTFATRTLREWVEWFEPLDVCFAPVNDLRTALDHPQVRHRNMVLVDERGWEHLGTPLQFADEPATISFDLPALGEHTGTILAEVGLSAADIDALEQAGGCQRPSQSDG